MNAPLLQSALPPSATDVRLTWSSRLLTLLGTVLIGSPESLRMPPDFYRSYTDRIPMDRSKSADVLGTWRPRILVDQVRRDITDRAAFIVGVAAASCGALLGLILHIAIS